METAQKHYFQFLYEIYIFQNTFYEKIKVRNLNNCVANLTLIFKKKKGAELFRRRTRGLIRLLI